MIYRKGDLVEVEFWDHTDGDEPYKFKVWGRLHRVTKLAYTVHTWAYSDITTELDDNVDQSTILKSTVVKMTRLFKRRSR